MNRFGVHTKTEAVDLALRHLAGQPMTRDAARSDDRPTQPADLPWAVFMTIVPFQEIWLRS
jgi:Arc/MetJ family transcription regulator